MELYLKHNQRDKLLFVYSLNDSYYAVSLIPRMSFSLKTACFSGFHSYELSYHNHYSKSKWIIEFVNEDGNEFSRIMSKYTLARNEEGKIVFNAKFKHIPTVRIEEYTEINRKEIDLHTLSLMEHYIREEKYSIELSSKLPIVFNSSIPLRNYSDKKDIKETQQGNSMKPELLNKEKKKIRDRKTYETSYISKYGRDKFNKISEKVLTSKKLAELNGISIQMSGTPSARDFLSAIKSMPYFMFAGTDTTILACLLAIKQWDEKVNSVYHFAPQHTLDSKVQSVFKMFGISET